MKPWPKWRRAAGCRTWVSNRARATVSAQVATKPSLAADPTRDTRTAQAARLGYASLRLTLRSLAGLAANLTVQIWQRAHALHVAAQARNNDGPLRFLTPVYPQAGRDRLIALLAGGSLIVAAMRLGA